jgi:hypothetical protein
MDRIPETGVDFKSLEQWCYDMGMAFARMLMTVVLTAVDRQLLDGRDKSVYRAKDLRPLPLKTLMGEVTVKRRYYRYTREDGRKEYVYLLDRAIGLDTIGRFSIGLVERIAGLITECSYRATAGTVSFLSGQSISHGGIWDAVRTVGERISELGTLRAEAAKNFISEGERVVKVLQEEFDGVWINMQGKDRPKTGHKLEMKLSAAYEGVTLRGKDKNGKPLHSLVNPLYAAGFEPADAFFRKKEGQIGAVYDLDEIDTRLINGDGGGWVVGFGEKSGCDHHFQLDRFHIERELTRGGIGKEDAERITGLFDRMRADEGLAHLKSLWEKEDDGEKKKKIGKVFGYLAGHADALTPILKRGLDLPEPGEGVDMYGPMGAMESTVGGVIALRMKKRRASFTKSGATNLAGLLCLRRSGKLDETVAGLSEMRLPVTLEEAITAVVSAMSAAKAPKHDGNGYEYPRIGGLPFEGAATTNGRLAVKGLASMRGLADLSFI